jgi:hypothetical protein
MWKNLLVALLLVLAPSLGEAQAQIPTISTKWKLPAPIKGNLVIYRVGFTQCSMFFSDEGMAKGTVAPNCVLLPDHVVPEGGFEYEILDVITTTED